MALLLLAGAAVSMWQAVRARRAEREAADALLVSEQSREEADQQRQHADEQRKKAETQAASVAMDMDLKYCEDGEIALGLLRLAETLRTMPPHAKELRECAALNILAWGQKIRPAWTIKHDGFDVTQAILSPDGRTVLSLGRDGTPRLWDAVSGKQQKILGQPLRAIQKWLGVVQFSKDGSTALVSAEGSGETDPVRLQLWDVATCRLRMSLSRDVTGVYNPRLSQNGSLLVTTDRESVFICNAMTGQLIRKVVCQKDHWPSIDVSPDGRWVLISQDGQFAVWSPESDQPLKRLPGDKAVFSPSGRYAASVSGDTVYWWDTNGWQLHRTINFKPPGGLSSAHASFITDEALGVGFFSFSDAFQLIILRNIPEIIRAFGKVYEFAANSIQASRNGRLVVLGSHVYDGLSGQRIPLPSGRRFNPELGQFSKDGRFTPFHVSYIVDLATDKKIDFMESNPYEWDGDGRFLKDLETWVVLSSSSSVHREADSPEGTITSPDRIYVLRKADVSLDAELLQKWCQVITRGKLDESGRLSKLDEATWEKARLELAHRLDANPNAQSLRAAVSDPLYWLRQEIKASEARNPPVFPLPLLDRLVAAEPTWPHYSQRAAAHAMLEHWDLAIQDELEAARLAGELYWLGGSPFTYWQIGARSVQAPGRPHEQYERALRWVDARIRAGVSGEQRISQYQYRPRSNVIAGLALFRLGRYADALPWLQKSDLPMLSEAAGMLMSHWNTLTLMEHTDTPHGEVTMFRRYSFDPVDLLVRAKCHHHLGHPKEAKACLNQARGTLGNNPNAINADQLAFLREAEWLIEGKPRP